MAKSIVLSKEYNRRSKYTSFFLNRQVHKSFLKDLKLSSPERQCIANKFNKYKYKYSIVRFKNYCILTGHSRSVYRDVNISRHKFNQMVLNGDLPSCQQHLGSFMNSSLSQLVGLIKLNLARRKLTAKVPFSNLNLNILKILYYEGYIRGFKVMETNTSKKIYVFFKLNNFKLSLLDIAYFCPKNKHSYLTYKKLVMFYGLKNFGIVSTNSGLLTLEQCFLHKKGGTLVLLIK